MGSMTRFLSNYGTNLKAALILWPLASFALTLPILAYLYHRDGRLRFGSVVATYLAVLYVLGIGCFTLWPLPEGDAGPGITYGVAPNFNPLNFIADIQKEGLRAVFQLAFNVVFFMPLGFIAGRLLRMRLVPTVLLALVTSVLVETAQYTGLFGLYDYAYRCCDVDDVITNTLGGLLGWVVARGFTMVVPQKLDTEGITDHPGFVRRSVALWLDYLLMELAAALVWVVVASASTAMTGGLPRFFGMDVDQTRTAVMAVLVAVAFVVVEIIVPWRHDGSTPGGSFVRMTFETHPRTRGYRVLFYAVRAITLWLVIYGPLTFWPLMPALLIFYLVCRRMPYDYIP